MCGITGFYSKTDKGLSNHNLVSSANSFQHRGPDSEGYYIKTCLLYTSDAADEE